ncbi:uncharacterized protein [Dermacentor andersoni]|uniref:uncharacterized protein n=1 Tax=Dermacentor andersoni TaxID=34620 RepID=UPI003B3ADD35
MEDVIFTPVSSGTRTLPPAAALQCLDLSNWHQQGASSGHGRAATMRSLLSSPFCFLMQGAFLPVLHSVADHSSDPSRIVTQGSWKPALSRGSYILKASPRQTRPWGPLTHKFMVLSFGWWSSAGCSSQGVRWCHGRLIACGQNSRRKLWWRCPLRRHIGEHVLGHVVYAPV